MYADRQFVALGLDLFKEKRILEVKGLEPRINSRAWSLMAWVKLPKNGGANILRKSLGKSQAEKDLSCWSWYVGWPSDRFDFGAHDFRGGSLTSELQESVAANASAAADGLLHNVALVVTSSNITFYMDAKVQVPLHVIFGQTCSRSGITQCVFQCLVSTAHPRHHSMQHVLRWFTF